jgi:hypothetical protein
MSGLITWDKNRKTGQGALSLRWENGIIEMRPWDTPISSGSDSHAIASQFGHFDKVDHDGEFVHVSRN